MIENSEQIIDLNFDLIEKTEQIIDLNFDLIENTEQIIDLNFDLIKIMPFEQVYTCMLLYGCMMYHNFMFIEIIDILLGILLV